MSFWISKIWSLAQWRDLPLAQCDYIPNELIHLCAMHLAYKTSICPLNEWFYDCGIVSWLFLWHRFCYFVTYTVWKHSFVTWKWVKKILAVPFIKSLHQELLFNKIVSPGIFLVLVYYARRNSGGILNGPAVKESASLHTCLSGTRYQHALSFRISLRRTLASVF